MISLQQQTYEFLTLKLLYLKLEFQDSCGLFSGLPRMEILPVLLSSNTTNLHRLYETVIDFICIISKLNTVDTDHIAVHQLVPLTSFSQATVRHACNA